MLPVLFTVTIPTSLGIAVWLAVSAASGAWQVRSAHAAGEKDLLKTFAIWTVGTAAVLFVAVRAIGGAENLDPGSPPGGSGAHHRDPVGRRVPPPHAPAAA